MRLTDADRAAWADWEAANAKAADSYEAMPLAHCNNGRYAKCVRCSTDVADPGLCHVCRGAS